MLCYHCWREMLDIPVDSLNVESKSGTATTIEGVVSSLKWIPANSSSSLNPHNIWWPLHLALEKINPSILFPYWEKVAFNIMFSGENFPCPGNGKEKGALITKSGIVHTSRKTPLPERTDVVSPIQTQTSQPFEIYILITELIWGCFLKQSKTAALPFLTLVAEWKWHFTSLTCEKKTQTIHYRRS